MRTDGRGGTDEEELELEIELEFSSPSDSYLDQEDNELDLEEDDVSSEDIDIELELEDNESIIESIKYDVAMEMVEEEKSSSLIVQEKLTQSERRTLEKLGIDPYIPSEERSEALSIIRNLDIIKKSATFTKSGLDTALEKIVKDSNTALSALRQEELNKKVSASISKAPEYIGERKASYIQKELNNYNHNYEEAVAIYKKVYEKDSEEVKGQESAEFAMFYSYLNDLAREVENTNSELDAAATQNQNLIEKYYNLIFKDQPMIHASMLDKSTNKNTTLISKVIMSDDGYSIVCGNCNHEQEGYGDLISILRVESSKIPTQTPIVCNHCGFINLLPYDGIKALIKSLKDDVTFFKTEFKEMSNVLLYGPSYYELEEIMPDLFFHIEKDEKEVQEIDLNWEELKKEYLELIKQIHVSRKVDTEKVLGLNEVAKILGEFSNSYSDLKEKAIASIIYELKSSQLELLEEDTLPRLSLPIYYEKKKEVYADKIAKDIESDCVKDDGSIDINKFNQDYKLYKEFVNKVPIIRERYLKELKENTVLFSGLPISNVKLSESDINNYLSDDRLRGILDEISDYMIISQQAERFIENFSPRKRSGNNTLLESSNQSYFSRWKDLTGENSIKSLWKIKENLEKYMNFFSDLLDSTRKVKFDTSEFLLNICADHTAIALISKFAKNVLDYDYYEAMVTRNQLLKSYHDELEAFNNSKKYKCVYEIIESFPSTNLTEDKYSFYFKDYGFSKKEKDKIIEVYNQKKSAPSDLKGDTFTEKLEYYTDLESHGKIETLSFPELTKFVEDNLVRLMGIKTLDSSVVFNEFMKYSIAKDMFIEFSRKLNISELCKVLFMKEIICKHYLDTNFSIPKGSFSMSSLFRELYISDSNIYTYLRDPGIDDDSLFGILEHEHKAILSELEGLEIPTQIAKDFLVIKEE